MTENNPNTLLDDLPPGGQTRFSTVFGAIGNYGMIATGLAYGGRQAYYLATKNPNALKFDRITSISLGMVALGSVIGTIHGFNEANNIQNYREAVANKIDALAHEAQGNREKIAELTRAVQKQAEDHHQTQSR